MDATERLLRHLSNAAPSQAGAVIRSIVQTGDVELLERVIDSDIAGQCGGADRNLVAALVRLPDVLEDRALAESLSARWIERCGGIKQNQLDTALAYAANIDLAEDLLRLGANPNAWLTNVRPGQEVTPLANAFEASNLPQVGLMLRALAARGEIPMYTRSASTPGDPLRQPGEGRTLFNYLVRTINMGGGQRNDAALLDDLHSIDMPAAWRLAIGQAFTKPPKGFDTGRFVFQPLSAEPLERFAQILAMADFEDPNGWKEALSRGGSPYELTDPLILRASHHPAVIEMVRRATKRGVHVDDFPCGHSPDDDNYYPATPLQVAVIYNQAGLAAELMEMGADVERRFPGPEDHCHKDYLGKSILDICKENSQYEIEQMINASLAKKRVDETLANVKHRAAAP